MMFLLREGGGTPRRVCQREGASEEEIVRLVCPPTDRPTQTKNRVSRVGSGPSADRRLKMTKKIGLNARVRAKRKRAPRRGTSAMRGTHMKVTVLPVDRRAALFSVLYRFFSRISTLS